MLRRCGQYLKTTSGRYYWDMYSKAEFIRACPVGSHVLDVGCGNDSPRVFKEMRPDCYYVGVDVSAYRQTTDPSAYADQYIEVPPEGFNEAIEARAHMFDAVVSSHNIEHCDDPRRTMVAMLNAVRGGGLLFMAFPSEASVHLPSRGGTLNFHDDPTHKVVPKFAEVCALIRASGFQIDVARKRYRPIVRVLEGLRLELRSRRENRTFPATWALYGFETIIWARRFAQ